MTLVLRGNGAIRRADMTNEIRIGIVCNADFRDKLDAALSDADPRLQFEVRCYTHQEQASGYAAELEPIVDAILFSGPVPYYISLEKRGPFSVPADFVVYDEVSLLKAFFDLASRDIDLSTISVDTISTATVRDVCGEIGIDPGGIRTMPLVEGGIHDDFAGFHIENYRAGRTTHALTCRSVVKATLDEAGIPCHFMFWTKHTILKALDLLVSRYMQAATVERRSRSACCGSASRASMHPSPKRGAWCWRWKVSFWKPPTGSASISWISVTVCICSIRPTVR